MRAPLPSLLSHVAAAAKGAVGADAEQGAQQQDGLTDWRELQQQLEASSWSGRFSGLAGHCGLRTLQEALSQREVGGSEFSLFATLSHSESLLRQFEVGAVVPRGLRNCSSAHGLEMIGRL